MAASWHDAQLHICLPRLSRGYNIGVRLIDEFLAKAKMERCANFKETAEVGEWLHKKVCRHRLAS